MVNHDGASNLLFQNNGNNNHFLHVNLIGISSNYDGIVTNIGFVSVTYTLAKVDVYNIPGKKVESLLEDVVSPGERWLFWDAEGIASGTYFYRITAGERAASGKMILMK